MHCCMMFSLSHPVTWWHGTTIVSLHASILWKVNFPDTSKAAMRQSRAPGTDYSRRVAGWQRFNGFHHESGPSDWSNQWLTCCHIVLSIKVLNLNRPIRKIQRSLLSVIDTLYRSIDIDIDILQLYFNFKQNMTVRVSDIQDKKT
jgi:hypothetical protein